MTIILDSLPPRPRGNDPGVERRLRPRGLESSQSIISPSASFDLAFPITAMDGGAWAREARDVVADIAFLVRVSCREVLPLKVSTKGSTLVVDSVEVRIGAADECVRGLVSSLFRDLASDDAVAHTLEGDCSP